MYIENNPTLQVLGNIFLDRWPEEVESSKLRILLESFNVEIPTYPKESMAKPLLEGSLLTECVEEVRSLARKLVLCKEIEEKQEKPGTVCVFEVVVKTEDNDVVIYEMVR